MIDVAGGGALDVERGPDWLFVKVNAAPGGWRHVTPLGESIWAVVQQHFTYRVVLECDDIGRLNSNVLGQLVQLRRRIRERGGVLRLCGLSDANRAMLSDCGLIDHLPHYMCRGTAVLADHSRVPR